MAQDGNESMETRFKAAVVWLILNGRAEQALKMLAEHYCVSVPKMKVGLPKGRKSKTLGCYSTKGKIISVLNSDTLKEPFVIIHEFYHHLRTAADSKHKGTERYANEFAKGFMEAYLTAARETTGNN
jgi:hypothetical protein